MPGPVLHASIFEQKRSLEELIDESKASQEFYLFLVVSTVITTLGLITDNSVVVIGGMLVAPILFPILFLSMALTTSSRAGITRAVKTLLKSILLVFGIALITAFLLGGREITHEILIRSKPDLISFLIAFFAGIAGAFGWVKHKLATTVAGIAVSVSLIPPLASFGIGLAILSGSVISGSITLFLVNLFGVVLAGLVIFILFGFGKLQEEEEEIIREEKVENEIKKQAVQEQKIQEKIKELNLTKDNDQ